MPNRAGESPAIQTIRCTTRTEAQGQAESNIRTAHELLRFWGVAMSPNRVVKHVRRFEREVTGRSFFDYLANAAQVDEQRRAETRAMLADPDELTPEQTDALLRTQYARDPVAVTAVRNWSRGAGRNG